MKPIAFPRFAWFAGLLLAAALTVSTVWFNGEWRKFDEPFTGPWHQ
jgi:hypothetical protein